MRSPSGSARRPIPRASGGGAPRAGGMPALPRAGGGGTSPAYQYLHTHKPSPFLSSPPGLRTISSACATCSSMEQIFQMRIGKMKRDHANLATQKDNIKMYYRQVSQDMDTSRLHIVALREQVHSLEGKLSAKTESLARLEKEKNSLQLAFAEFEKYCESLEGVLTEKDRLQQQCDALLQAADEHKSTICSLEASAAEACEQHAQVMDVYSEKCQAFEQQSATVNALRNEAQSQEAVVARLRENLSHTSEELAASETTAKAMEDRLRKTSSRHKNVLEEKTQTIASLEEKVQELDGRVRARDRDLALARKNCEKKERLVEKHKDSLAVAAKALDRAKESANKSEKHIAAKENELRRLHASLSKQRSAADGAKDELKEAREQVCLLKAQLQQGTAEAKQALEDHTSGVKARMEAREEAIRTRCKEAVARVSALLNAERAHHETTKSTLMTTRKAAADARASALGFRERFNRMRGAALSERRSTMIALATSEVARHKLEEQLEQTTEEHTLLERQLRQDQIARASLEESERTSKDSIARLSARIESLSARMASPEGTERTTPPMPAAEKAIPIGYEKVDAPPPRFALRTLNARLSGSPNTKPSLLRACASSKENASSPGVSLLSIAKKTSTSP